MRIEGTNLKNPSMSGAYNQSTYFAEQAVSPAIGSCFPREVCKPEDSQREAGWRWYCCHCQALAPTLLTVMVLQRQLTRMGLPQTKRGPRPYTLVWGEGKCFWVRLAVS